MKNYALAFMIFFLLMASLFTGCSTKSTVHNDTNSKNKIVSLNEINIVSSQISRWSKSFLGKTKTEAIKMLSGVKPITTTWHHNTKDKLLLKFYLPEGQLSLYFSEGKIITVSMFYVYN